MHQDQTQVAGTQIRIGRKRFASCHPSGSIIEGARDLAGHKQRLAIDRCYTYFVCFLYLLKFFPCVFVRICIWVKFAGELSGASDTSSCDELGNYDAIRTEK